MKPFWSNSHPKRFNTKYERSNTKCCFIWKCKRSYTKKSKNNTTNNQNILETPTEMNIKKTLNIKIFLSSFFPNDLRLLDSFMITNNNKWHSSTSHMKYSVHIYIYYTRILTLTIKASDCTKYENSMFLLLPHKQY